VSAQEENTSVINISMQRKEFADTVSCFAMKVLQRTPKHKKTRRTTVQDPRKFIHVTGWVEATS
jgi:hypothetical protein